jgi:hypothetical protein
VEVSVWLIELPDPADAPVTFDDEDTIQLNVVPGAALGFVIGIAVELPEQMV